MTKTSGLVAEYMAHDSLKTPVWRGGLRILQSVFLKREAPQRSPKERLEGRLEIGQRTAMSKRPDLAPHLQICTHQLEPACEVHW